MKVIHPAIIWDIERRKREIETDHRIPLYLPVPEYEREVPKNTEIDYTIEF